MSSALAGICCSVLKGMSASANPFACRISVEQRTRLLRSIFEAFYEEILLSGRTVFDTSRRWCALLPVIVDLFPSTRVLCCVRSPAWILDSIERFVQKNAAEPSRLFNNDADATVYNRVALLMNDGFVGRALNGLRQAWFGDQASYLIALCYESLVTQPAETVARLYQLLGEEPFEHDYNNLSYEEPNFDAELGFPGFHRVSGPILLKERATVLPPDIFHRHDQSFWRDPAENPRNVVVL